MIMVKTQQQSDIIWNRMFACIRSLVVKGKRLNMKSKFLCFVILAWISFLISSINFLTNDNKLTVKLFGFMLLILMSSTYFSAHLQAPSIQLNPLPINWIVFAELFLISLTFASLEEQTIGQPNEAFHVFCATRNFNPWSCPMTSTNQQSTSQVKHPSEL